MANPAFDQILGFARDDDAEAVRAALQVGCPPTYCNRMGQSALHIAAIWGSTRALKVLLDAKADPGQQNQLRGSTPFHAAAMGRGPIEKRADCVKLMIAAKGNPNKADFGGEKPIDAANEEVLRLAFGAAPLILHKAVRGKQLAQVKRALAEIQQGATELTLESQDPRGETALHVAVTEGYREGLSFLLDCKANPSTSNGQLRTPLHTAVLQGNNRILELLLAAKADANMKDADPEADPRFSSSTFEVDASEHRAPLHYAAELGNAAGIRLLLRDGHADPNALDSRKMTPLHVCLGLFEPGLELEIGAGVKVSGLQKRPEWNGRFGTIIGEAAAPLEAGKPARWPVALDGEAAEGVLLQAANLHRIDEEALDALLEAKADVNLGNQVTGEKRTTLHLAVHSGNKLLTRKVIAAVADLERLDNQGFSALHLAARVGNDDLIRLLVEARANTSTVSTSGKTAAELAEKKADRLKPSTLRLLNGENVTEDVDMEPEPAQKAAPPQSLEALTAEQRAALFID